MFLRLKIIAITLCSLLAFGVLSARADISFPKLLETEKSIVTVRTELTRVMHTTPPKVATYYRTAIGIVIDPSGIILTNTHTIIHAPSVYVILRDGTKFRAKVIFSSHHYDFSFLKIYPHHRLAHIRWADSSRVSMGESILALGNPDNHHQPILSGHIKGIHQSRSNSGNDFLELDLNLYHGDSGGPILDSQGRLLGIIMAKRQSAPNSSLAIASNKIRLQYLHYKKNMP